MLDPRKKRLVYRANYRGFKEADLILGGYVKENIEDMSDEDLTLFEALLEAKDHDIYAWITGSLPVPKVYDTPLLRKLKNFSPSR